MKKKKTEKQKLDWCLILLSAFLVSNCGTAVNPVPSPRAAATQLTESSIPTIYLSQIALPIKTEKPTVEITNNPVDAHLDLGNIESGQYLLA